MPSSTGLLRRSRDLDGHAIRENRPGVLAEESLRGCRGGLSVARFCLSLSEAVQSVIVVKRAGAVRHGFGKLLHRHRESAPLKITPAIYKQLPPDGPIACGP